MDLALTFEYIDIYVYIYICIFIATCTVYVVSAGGAIFGPGHVICMFTLCHFVFLPHPSLPLSSPLPSPPLPLPSPPPNFPHLLLLHSATSREYQSLIEVRPYVCYSLSLTPVVAEFVCCKVLSVECGVLMYLSKAKSTECPSVVVCCIPLCVTVVDLVYVRM